MLDIDRYMDTGRYRRDTTGRSKQGIPKYTPGKARIQLDTYGFSGIWWDIVEPLQNG